MAQIYVRVDDRLIHGQTVIAWCPTLGIKEIIGIDDVSASNPLLKSIMTMGVPKHYKTSIATTDEARELLKEDHNDNCLVIVKFPEVLKRLREVLKGDEIIILGNIAKREDTIYNMKEGTGIFYLSQEDVNVIDDLVQSGFEVSFQQLPNTTRVSWESFKKTL